MNEHAYKQTTVVASPAPAASTVFDAMAPVAQPYVPGFFDRQLDRFIAVCERVMPDLAGLGLAMLLAILVAIACGANLATDDLTYPMPMDASGIEDALSIPADPAASAVVAKPSPNGEVQDTRAPARVR